MEFQRKIQSELGEGGSTQTQTTDKASSHIPETKTRVTIV